MPCLWFRRLRTLCVVSAVLAAMVVLGSPAQAATFTVSNTDDSDAGSLRQAVLDANATPGADTIDFSVTGTITLTSGQLTVTDDLTIDGPGAASLTVSGNNTTRVMQVAGATLYLDGLTVANGHANAGGGIVNNFDAT